jgi:hypothetical protein
MGDGDGWENAKIDVGCQEAQETRCYFRLRHHCSLHVLAPGQCDCGSRQNFPPDCRSAASGSGIRWVHADERHDAADERHDAQGTQRGMGTALAADEGVVVVVVVDVGVVANSAMSERGSDS